MNINLYSLLLMKYFKLVKEEITEIDGEIYVKTGYLMNRKTGEKAPIINYIPRFVIDDNYVSSFSYQWDKFRDLQHDSKNGRHESENRLFKNTKWEKGKLKGKIILECGSGPGRFTEIFSDGGGYVVAIDMSGAIDVNLDNLGLRPNILYIQDDITKLFYMKAMADYVFCYGVLQHTRQPRKTLHRLLKYAKPNGGKISIDVYIKETKPSPFYFPKYFWRPVTRNMDKEKLLKIIKWYIPKYIGFDTFMRHIQYKNIPIGNYILGIIPIPCWNYVDCGYTDYERIQLAIMDTFDALSPKYDYPFSLEEIEKYADYEYGAKNIKRYHVFRGSNGVVMNAEK